VYRFENEEKEMLDPALVLTGTKCGSHHVGTVPACNGLGHFMVSLSHVESADYQGTHLFVVQCLSRGFLCLSEINFLGVSE